RCSHYRRDQGNILATKRAVNKGFLPIAGGFQNIVANKTERPAQIETRSRQIFYQRGSEGAVLAVAIDRDGAGLGGIGDHRVGTVRLDPDQPAPDAARGEVVSLGLAEGAVAARVQNDEPEFLHRLDDRQDAIERYGFVEGIDVAFQHGIDRDEIIDAFNFDPVPGKINDGDVGIADVVGEIA